MVCHHPLNNDTCYLLPKNCCDSGVIHTDACGASTELPLVLCVFEVCFGHQIQTKQIVFVLFSVMSIKMSEFTFCFIAL